MGRKIKIEPAIGKTKESMDVECPKCRYASEKIFIRYDTW
jgi:hypothetical protein